MTNKGSSSAALGAVLLLLVGLLVGGLLPRAVRAQQALEFPPRSVRVVGIYDPHDAVILRAEDGPFTVPVGKLFILTGLGEQGATPGTVRYFQHVTLYSNGEAVVMRAGNYQETATLQCSITQVAPGFTAYGGDVLLVAASGGLGGNARAWGFLIDD